MPWDGGRESFRAAAARDCRPRAPARARCQQGESPCHAETLTCDENWAHSATRGMRRGCDLFSFLSLSPERSGSEPVAELRRGTQGRGDLESVQQIADAPQRNRLGHRGVDKRDFLRHTILVVSSAASCLPVPGTADTSRRRRGTRAAVRVSGFTVRA